MKRIAFDEQPPTQLGKVIFARFIILDETMNTYAIHVYKTQKKTKFKFIPRPEKK